MLPHAQQRNHTQEAADLKVTSTSKKQNPVQLLEETQNTLVALEQTKTHTKSAHWCNVRKSAFERKLPLDRDQAEGFFIR